MAKFQNGVLGSFDGKVGTIVGAKWKGVEYIRHKGRKSKKPFTEAQLEHQAKFRCVGKFVNKLSDLLKETYPVSSRRTSINYAFADIYAKAITGSYPAFDLDYIKVSVSKGVLFNGESVQANASGNGIIKFTWVDNTDDNMAKADDRAVLVAYCPELELPVFTLQGGARSDGAGTLTMKNYIGKEVETWIAFLSANGKEVSSIIYSGQLTVS